MGLNCVKFEEEVREESMCGRGIRETQSVGEGGAGVTVLGWGQAATIDLCESWTDYHWLLSSSPHSTLYPTPTLFPIHDPFVTKLGQRFLLAEHFNFIFSLFFGCKQRQILFISQIIF
jgi:hypothetical protein